MYCVNCGVKLQDNEKECPLCNTEVVYPEKKSGESLYPNKTYPSVRTGTFWPQIIFTVAFLTPILIVLLCDLQVNSAVTWAGYVIGALLTAYVTFILPLWFKKPNPVIFVPCSFAAAGAYLLYINLFTNGRWFLSFAFPIVAGIGLIITTVTVLLRYVRRGKLYIFGGATLALGLFMLPIEFLANFTFNVSRFAGWSFYPLVALVLFGGMLIFLAICRPARETMERKFFI